MKKQLLMGAHQEYIQSPLGLSGEEREHSTKRSLKRFDVKKKWVVLKPPH